MKLSRLLAACALACFSLLAARAEAEELTRADFTMTLPAGSTVDKPDGDVDADHMSTVNLPNDATMIVLVLDDKQFAPKAWDKMIETYKSKMKDAVEGTTDTFSKVKASRTGILSGSLNGLKFSFEMGEIDGSKKAIVVVCAYLEKNKAETVKLLQGALDTLKIKE